MADSQPSTRTGRVASQLTDTDSPKPKTTLEGFRIREQPSPDTETHSSNYLHHFPIITTVGLHLYAKSCNDLHIM